MYKFTDNQSIQDHRAASQWNFVSFSWILSLKIVGGGEEGCHLAPSRILTPGVKPHLSHSLLTGFACTLPCGPTFSDFSTSKQLNTAYFCMCKHKILCKKRSYNEGLIQIKSKIRTKKDSLLKIKIVLFLFANSKVPNKPNTKNSQKWYKFVFQINY